MTHFQTTCLLFLYPNFDLHSGDKTPAHIYFCTKIFTSIHKVSIFLFIVPLLSTEGSQRLLQNSLPLAIQHTLLAKFSTTYLAVAVAQ
jgi:hypothetical protein